MAVDPRPDDAAVEAACIEHVGQDVWDQWPEDFRHHACNDMARALAAACLRWAEQTRLGRLTPSLGLTNNSIVELAFRVKAAELTGADDAR